MLFLRKLYALYSAAIFFILMLLFSPFFLIIIELKKFKKLVPKIIQVWGRGFFSLSFLPVKMYYPKNFPLDTKCIICANHFSYLDIPLLGYSRFPVCFVGKVSLTKVPLFGYIFKNTHITVDRSSLRDKFGALVRAKKEMKNGRTIVVSP